VCKYASVCVCVCVRPTDRWTLYIAHKFYCKTTTAEQQQRRRSSSDQNKI